MFACRQRDAAEIAGDTAAFMEVCPACRGEMPGRESCTTCSGMGGVDAADPRELLEGGQADLPEWVAVCGEAVSAWSGIEKFGLDGWMRLAGVEEVSEVLLPAISEIAGELARLEHQERVREARRKK